jgi:GDP/UDP-N,N'-diacetylbacillosamine 2-epimerase (hydrolysing)
MALQKRKIALITATRAEYGLLFWLLKEIESDKNLILELYVTGMHLSEAFGLTYKEIEKEFTITQKIPLSLDDDSSQGLSQDMATLQMAMTQILSERKPDILVILGDRYEMLSCAIAAMVTNTPIAHIHGGETTQGAMDEAIRHSITKMAHLHFCATQSYKKRVIQLGEDPKRVFFVGGMGIDNIKKLSLLDKEAFEQSIDFKLAKRNLLVTFHPTTLENNSSKKQFMELLKAIDSLQDTHTIFTKANSDKDGKIINTLIDNYVAKHPQTSVAFHSLGQLRYLSALQFVDVVVGNSSSGLLEVPSFQKATINIGERQKGREKAISVIDVAPKKEEICQALKQVQTPEFLHLLKRVTNPYDAGGAAHKVKEILKEYPLENILKKEFYDCKC